MKGITGEGGKREKGGKPFLLGLSMEKELRGIITGALSGSEERTDEMLSDMPDEYLLCLCGLAKSDQISLAVG